MKTSLAPLLTILRALTFVLTPARADDAKEKAEVIKIGRALDQAIIKKDTSTLVDTLSDDCIGIWADGNTSTKAEILEAVKSGAYKLYSVDYKEENVRIYGNTAVSTVLASADEEMDGKREKTLGWSTTVWVKKSGACKIVSVHSSYKEKKAAQ
jgi:hypothetical protein